MEFLTELMSKMTIENLFKLQPSTDFSYSYLVFWFLIFLVVFSFVFDYIAKHQENKYRIQNFKNIKSSKCLENTKSGLTAIPDSVFSMI